MDKDLGLLFSEVKRDVETYVDLRLKLFRLGFYEKTGRVSSAFAYGMIMACVVFFTIFFLFLGLGFCLGTLLNSIALGMFLVGLLCLIILGVMFLYRNKLKSWLLNLFISELTANDNNNDKDE